MINRLLATLLTHVVLFALDRRSTIDAGGHRILMLPVSMSSHQLYFGKLGQGLSKLGHSVEMLSPSSARIPRKLAGGNFTITSYPVVNKTSMFDSPETSKRYIDFALSDHGISDWLDFWNWFMRRLLPAIDLECESLLDNLALMENIINQSRFEFIILDVMTTDCYHEIVKTLKVPYGLLSIPFLSWTAGIPRLPSFVPNYLSALSDKMTFGQRLQTFLADISIFFALQTTKRRDFRRPYMKYESTTTGSTRFIDIVKGADLHLYLEDFIAGYPKPIMPNVVPVGDIMVGSPGLALPADLDSFLGNGTGVLFSLGSYVQVATDEVARKYCKAFRDLRDAKIIWKSNDPKVCDEHFAGGLENLLVVPWIPQNDLLADDRIKVFITHGGLNSMMESIYHAKPVVVFPLAVDQRAQAGSAQTKQHGIHMDLSNWQPEDLVENVEEILRNPLYRNNAKLYSDMLRSRADTAAERTSRALEFVLKFGSRYIKSGSQELHWFQLFMFDICLVIFLALSCITMACSCCCFRLMKRSFCRGKHKMKQS